MAEELPKVFPRSTKFFLLIAYFSLLVSASIKKSRENAFCIKYFSNLTVAILLKTKLSPLQLQSKEISIFLQFFIQFHLCVSLLSQIKITTVYSPMFNDICGLQFRKKSTPTFYLTPAFSFWSASFF